MGKKQIDAKISVAYDSIRRCGLLSANGTLNKAFQGQIAAFGAAVRNGSLLAAIAFFSNQGGADCDRTKLMDCIHVILFPAEGVQKGKNALFQKVIGQKAVKSDILDAAVALKLAMNLYPMEEKEGACDGASSSEEAEL